MGERCGIIPGNKAEVAASHLKQKAYGVNRKYRESTGDLFECGEIVFHRIFCFKIFRRCFLSVRNC